MSIDRDLAAVRCDGAGCDAKIPIPLHLADRGFQTVVQVRGLVESHGWYTDLNGVTLCQPCQSKTFRQA
jgi:hypothetical protein